MYVCMVLHTTHIGVVWWLWFVEYNFVFVEKWVFWFLVWGWRNGKDGRKVGVIYALLWYTHVSIFFRPHTNRRNKG